MLHYIYTHYYPWPPKYDDQGELYILNTFKILQVDYQSFSVWRRQLDIVILWASNQQN